MNPMFETRIAWARSFARSSSPLLSRYQKRPVAFRKCSVFSFVKCARILNGS